MSLTVTKVLYTVDIVDGSGNTVTVSPVTQTVDVASSGPQGATGPTVVSVAVGTTSTGTAGSSASVTNVGTSTSAILNFTIPRGDTGAAGSAATITVGSVTTLPAGSAATVTNTGTSSAATFAFGIPQGAKGDTGSTGTAATISVGTVTTLAAGSPATVTNTGTSSAAIFNFGIPAGSAGLQGAAGSAATIAVGTVTQGTAVSVTNVGTSSAAVFDFVLVKGDKGDTGNTGPQGSTGATGASGVVTVNAPLTNSGSAGSANISIGTASTGGVYGVTTLTDSTSSTSTTTAATPASVKLAFDAAGSAVSADNYHRAQGFLTTTIETIPRPVVALASVTWGASGRIQFAMFTPVKNLTVGTASFYCSGTPTTTTTARMGLYTWDQTTGTATLVAQTANDTTLFASANVSQSRAFDTTGGFPSTYTLVAGSAYAFGMIWVGTGLPNALGLFINVSSGHRSIAPRPDGFKSLQTDLATVGSLGDSGIRIWGRFS